MYFLVPLIFAATVLGAPHQARDTSSASSDVTACPGAPPVPSGAVPGDLCNSTPPTSTISTSPSPTTSRRRKMKKRDGFSSCQAVTLDQYNSSPMVSPLASMASTNWGSDFTLVVNPPDFPNNPLQFCYTTDSTPATLDNPPTCSVSQTNITGNVANGTADVTLSVVQGLTSTHAVSTEKAASISSATAIQLTLGVPEIDSVDVTETVTVTGTFTQGFSDTTTLNQQTTETVVAHATKPGPCNVILNVTTCTGQATAIVPAFYTGFVWFNYGSTRDGHFKWALNVDSVLPADQRSSNATLTDKISSTNNGQFTSVCI